jgi:acylphosphatase
MSLRHYLVSGRVQGVGFRRFVEKHAIQYQVSGVVRNLEDGRVECIAQGSDEALKEFERAVRRGPMLSAVRDVVARSISNLTESYRTEVAAEWKTGLFSILVDGERPWLEEES